MRGELSYPTQSKCVDASPTAGYCLPSFHQTVYPVYAMPRGNPKRKVMLRLDPSMIERVRERASGGNCTRAAEQAIEAWLKRAGRKAQTDPTAREIATRTKDGA